MRSSASQGRCGAFPLVMRHVSTTFDTGHSDPFQRKCAGVPSAAHVIATGWL